MLSKVRDGSLLILMSLIVVGLVEASDVTELDEVLVESEGEPETELPLGIGISGETLRRIPGSAGDPIKGLQSFPGMTFADDSEGEPAVRGSRPGDNYIEADFLPVGYLFHADGIISVFNSDLVESFSVYPSAYGPEYSGVTGGVIDVRLRDPKTDRVHGSLDVSLLHAGALIEGPVTTNQSFYLAGRMSYLDLFIEGQLNDLDGIEFKQFPKYNDYQAKYVWHTAEDSELRFQLIGASDLQEIIVSEDSEEIDNEPIFAGRHYSKDQFHEQGVVWDKRLSNGAAVKSSVAHANTSGVTQAGGLGESKIKLSRWILKSHVNIPVADGHELKLGVEAVEIKADLELAFNDPGCTEFEAECSLTGADRLSTKESLNINGYSAFLKDTWHVNDRLTLFPSVVVHGENYLDKSFIEPRFSMEYSISDDLILSAGAGVYNSMPNYFQVNKVFGNPNLDYIKSEQGVVGLQKFLPGGWDIKSELYYKTMKNLVTGDEQFRYANNGKGIAYGLDTLIRKSVTDKLSGWLSVSLSKANREHKKTGDSFSFEYDQPFNASLVGSYKMSPRWEVGAKLWVHSGKPYTPVISASEDPEQDGYYIPVYADVNSKRFPMYHRLDIRVDRIIKKKNGRSISAYLEILNVLDTKNISEYDYNSDYSERAEVAQLPRIIALGFRAGF